MPMPTLAATRIEKCIGSIPSNTATGTRIGIRMMIGGSASITIPSTMNTTCTKSMNTSQFGAVLVIHSASWWGMRSNVSTNEKTEAEASTSITTPVKDAVPNSTSGRSASFSSRYTKNDTTKP